MCLELILISIVPLAGLEVNTPSGISQGKRIYPVRTFSR
jgi:hypothetical protein